MSSALSLAPHGSRRCSECTPPRTCWISPQAVWPAAAPAEPLTDVAEIISSPTTACWTRWTSPSRALCSV
eukprot:scaffold650043_cov38-Prasinocladus_malaysianus.AAC.1